MGAFQGVGGRGLCVLRDAPCRSCCAQLCLDSAFQRQRNACAPMRFWIVVRLLISGESMPSVSKFSAARGFSRPRAVVCGHHYCVSPKVGSFVHLWHTVLLQSFPKPSYLDCKLWPIGTVIHRLCADRVRQVCKHVEAHFNILDRLAQ